MKFLKCLKCLPLLLLASSVLATDPAPPNASFIDPDEGFPDDEMNLPAPVSAPSAGLLLSLGLAGLIVLRRRQR